MKHGHLQGTITRPKIDLVIEEWKKNNQLQFHSLEQSEQNLALSQPRANSISGLAGKIQFACFVNSSGCLLALSIFFKRYFLFKPYFAFSSRRMHHYRKLIKQNGNEDLVLLLSFTFFTFHTVSTDLFVVFFQSGQIFSGLREFTFFHTLTDKPVNKGAFCIHQIKFVI